MLMDAAVKELWVAALESGDYVQGTGMLKNTCGGFCCLGVLCELYRREVGGGWRLEEENDLVVFADTDGGTDYEVCPDGVASWAGLDKKDPFVSGRHLSDWNDNERITFNSIANLIRENL